MGWATVVESRADDIALGRRFYGWYPMSSHVVFTPTATKDGFRDDGAHRQAHAPVYRAYVATDADPMYPEADHGTQGLADGEDRHALLRGLFLTGLPRRGVLRRRRGIRVGPYFGAARVIVLSASSKTAIGFAQRAHLRGGVEVVGVTSAGNVEWSSSSATTTESSPTTTSTRCRPTGVPSRSTWPATRRRSPRSTTGSARISHIR